MLKYATAYIFTAAIFLVLDFFWLSIMATSFYRARLPDVIALNVNYVPAVLFYLIYVAGLVIFAVNPAMETGRWQTALSHGALLGFVAYATYDLTSQATLKQWSTVVTLADMAWGTLLSGISASLGFLAARWVAAKFG